MDSTFPAHSKLHLSNDPMSLMIREGCIKELNVKKVADDNCELRGLALRGLDADGLDFRNYYFAKLTFAVLTLARPSSMAPVSMRAQVPACCSQRS